MSSYHAIFYVPRGRRRFVIAAVQTLDAKEHAKLHHEAREIGVCYCGRRTRSRCRVCGWELPQRRRDRTAFEDSLDAALRLSLEEQAKRRVLDQK